MINHFRRIFQGILCLLTVVLMFMEFSTAAAASGFPETAARKRLSLAGSWQAREKKSPRWFAVRVPGRLPAAKVYFLKREFQIPAHLKDYRFTLVVDGINFKSTIKINNQYVGDVPAGYEALSFKMEPGILHGGKNQIFIEIDAAQNFKYSLPVKGGLLEPELPRGIIRAIYIYAVPPVSLLKPAITYRIQNLSRIKLNIGADVVSETSAGTAGGKITVRIESPEGIALFSGDVPVVSGHVQTTIHIPAGRLWTPRFPVLYRVVLTLKNEAGQILDTWFTTVGFREFRVENGHFVLNRKPLKLKGITVFPKDFRQSGPDFGNWVKKLGANAVLFIYPPAPEMFREADSLGFFIFSGLPLWNSPADVWGNEVFLDNVSQFKKEFLENVQNHPSFCGFTAGVGNDGLGKDYFRFFPVKKPSKEKHFLTGAGFRTGTVETKSYPFDWVGFDLTNWVKPDWKKAVTHFRERFPAVPIIFSQVSVPFLKEHNRTEDQIRFEKRQGYTLWKTVREMLDSPDVAGCFVFTDRDYQGMYPTFLNPYVKDRRLFRMGLESNSNASPRLSWKMIHDLYTGNGPGFAEFVQNRDSGKTAFLLWGFAVIIFFLYFLKGNKRISGNFVRVFARPKGFYMELQSGRKIAWGHSLIINFSASAALAILTASLFFSAKESILFDFFMTQLLFFRGLKTQLIPLVWNPAVFVLVLTFFFFLFFSLLAVVLQTAAVMTGRSLKLRNALALVYWLSGVFIFLVPIAMVSARIWVYPVLKYLIFGLVLILFLWFVYRILKGMTVILHYSPGITAFVMTGMAGLVLGILLWLYQVHSNFLPYLGYIFHVWKAGI